MIAKVEMTADKPQEGLTFLHFLSTEDIAESLFPSLASRFPFKCINKY